jgi:hypothetical protein
MTFTCVYCKTKKKIEKFFKVNKIRNKYVLDIKKMMEEEEMDSDTDKMFIKILIIEKVQKAIEKGKDIYYIPNFDEEFNINKLLNLRSILGSNDFNVLIFYDEFQKHPHIIDEALDNLENFDNSQIIRDY